MNKLNFKNLDKYKISIKNIDKYDEKNFNIQQYKDELYNDFYKNFDLKTEEEKINNIILNIQENIFSFIFEHSQIKNINYFNEIKNIDKNKLFFNINFYYLLEKLKDKNIFFTDLELIQELKIFYLNVENNYLLETFNLFNFIIFRNKEIFKEDNIELNFINTFILNTDFNLDIDEKTTKNYIIDIIIKNCFNKKIELKELTDFIINEFNLITNDNNFNNFIKSLNYLLNEKDIDKIIQNNTFSNNSIKKIEIDIKSFKLENALFNSNNYKTDFEKAIDFIELTTKASTEEKIVNGFLTFDSELKELNKSHQEELNKLEQIISKLEDIKITDFTSGVTNILSSINEYYKLVKTGNKNHLNNLENIFNNSYSNNSLFSKDFCSILYLIIYTMYSSIDEEPLKNINDSNEYSEKLSKLTGIKSLPGYLEINQIKTENWNAKANFMKDSKFFKLYSNFYNFYTKEKNPFNNTLKDKDFEKMQNLAIKAKRLLESQSDSNVQNKLNDLFYKPQGGANHSIYTYTNLIADLFKEFNEPIEFELLENFGVSLISFLKNLSLETGTSLLLEWTLELFSKEWIEINNKKYSIMSIYNELYMLKKIFYLIKNDDQNLNEILKMNLNEISTSVLENSKLGKILKEEAFFALNGLDFSNSLIYDINKLFNNKENVSGFYLDLLYTYKEKDEEYIWNLKAINLPAWVTVKFAIDKYKKIDPELITLDLKNKSFLNRLIGSLTINENSYAFLCSILNKKDYIEYLNNNMSLNYSKDDIENILNLLPSSVNDNNFNYYESYEELYNKYFSILKLNNLYDYKNYKNSIRKDLVLFSRTVSYNYEAILDAILSTESSPLIDTIMRLLPTTKLLFGTFNLPLDLYLDKLLSWFDELLFTLLNYLKKLMYENKIKFIENYKRERLYLIKNSWDYRIRSFNIVLDIIYLNMGTATFCLQHDYKNDKEILLDIYNQIIDKIENTKNDDIKNDLENPKDKNIKIPDFPNPINPDEIKDFNDENIKKEIETSFDNKIVIVENNNKDENKRIIVIIPNEDDFIENYNKSKDTIITKPINKDEELLEETNKDEIVKLEINYDSEWLDNIIDFLKPGNEEIKKDIFNSYITKDLNHLFYQNTPGNLIYNKEEILSKRYLELNENSISFSDVNFYSFINFNIINFKIFNETLESFNLETYEKVKNTSLEFFSNF